jgi:ketosteroid isomerase-like protein
MNGSRVIVAMLLSLAASPALAQQKPDFSGEWTLSMRRSRLEADWARGIERGVVRIAHGEPRFDFERTFTTQGEDSQASYTLTTDGVAVEQVSGPRTESSRMYWEGDVLVLSQTLEGPMGVGTNIVHYRLLEGGRVLEASERTTGPGAYSNLWLFEKGGPGTDDRTVVEQTIRDAIGWALTKDRPLAERVIAHDPELFMFNPDSTSVLGWDAFVKNFDFWMDPRFKATSFDVRDLRVTFSRSGDVAWWSAILDDLGEWDGKPTGWKDTRWTGVLERRDGAWVIPQMHFSFAAPG